MNNNTYTDTNVNNYIQQLWFLPFIYFIYCFKTIKQIKNYSINEVTSKKDIYLQLSYSLIGILTINFYLYVGIEFELFHYDFNRIINEIYFIPFYLKNFSILLIFSIVIYLIISFKTTFQMNYFRSILLFNIKLFNIFMPILFSALIITTNYSFYFSSKNQMENVTITLLSFVGFTFIVLLLVYVSMLLKSRVFFITIFEKKYLANILLFITILISSTIYIVSATTLPNYIGLNKLIHSYEFCDEITSFILYKNKINPKKDYTFYEYRKEIQECQKMWDLTGRELIDWIKDKESK